LPKSLVRVQVFIIILPSFFTQPIIKPQYVDSIPKVARGTVIGLITAKSEKNIAEDIIANLDLKEVLNRQIEDLSGGELQRFAIAISCIQNADM